MREDVGDRGLIKAKNRTLWQYDLPSNSERRVNGHSQSLPQSIALGRLLSIIISLLSGQFSGRILVGNLESLVVVHALHCVVVFGDCLRALDDLP